MRAKLIDLVVTSGGDSRLTVSTSEDITQLYDDLHDSPVSVTVKKFSEKRGLSANAMYWLYLGELAKVLGISNPAMHNVLIRKYGVPETFGGKLAYTFIPDTDEAYTQALEAETYHIKPTSRTKDGNDGETYRAYMIMRGSSTYDTAEFARLLDGLIQDCEEVDIHVRTDREE